MDPDMKCLSCGLLRITVPLLACSAIALPGQAQTQQNSAEVEELKQLAFDLQRRVATLEQQNQQLRQTPAPAGATGPQAAASLVLAADELRTADGTSPVAAQSAAATAVSSAPPLPGTLPGGATLNYFFDGYYEYNFNQPVGRVNDLRAYDVLSNTFSINQADFIFALDPDTSAHRPFGFRVDLQFGQATETLQGNPANEPRPEIYRNIFQAYGTYIVPAGHGIQVDFGKFSSSLGFENNYTQDQMNYSRSFWFDFLPFYHMGARVGYQLTKELNLHYWTVNGTDQTEPFNGFKDESIGFTIQPNSKISWIANYY